MKKPQTKSAPAKPTAASTHEVELEIVEALARIAGQHDLSELVLERGALHIRVARGMKPLPAAYVATPVPVAHSSVAAVPQALKTVAEPQAPVEAAGTVKSPMVGTAYLRPSPEAKAFIEIGQSVKEGEKVLLVEAMKTFNEILAPRSGTVTHIFVEDGTPVEYGQPLLAIS